MPSRPAFTSKLSLPVRLKHNNSTNSTPSSLPNSRKVSPQRQMSENTKPGLVLRANVLKVRATPPTPTESSQKLTCNPGPQPRRKGQERNF